MKPASRHDTLPAVILIAAATFFTIGRSVIVARNGMRLSPRVAQGVAVGNARIVAASTGPDMNAINHDLSRGDPMQAAPEQSPRVQVPVAPGPAAAATAQAKPAIVAEQLRLVGLSSDFAIVHDTAGDHSLRIGGRLGNLTLRQITGSTVLMDRDDGVSITLSRPRADRQ